MPRKGEWDYRKEGRNKTDRKRGDVVDIVEINGHPVKAETAELIVQAAEKIMEGATRKEVTEFLSEKNGSRSKDYLGDLYHAALKYLKPTEDYRQGLAMANMARLDRIVDDTITKDRRTSIEAIKEINRMIGVTGGNIVAVQHNEDGTTNFTVKFGE